MCLYVVVEPTLLLAYQLVGLTLADWLCGMALTIPENVLCGVWPHRVGFTVAGLWCLLNSPFRCVVYITNCEVLCYCLKPDTLCVSSGVSWEVLWCRPRSAVTCVLAGPSGKSYSVICD